MQVHIHIYIISGVGSNCGLGGPKCIGRMTQNNINPVNNNAINKDKYTNVNNVSNLLRSIRRILKLRNPEKNENIFLHMVPLRIHGHIYGQIIGGGARLPCCIIGGASAPPGPPSSYSTAYTREKVFVRSNALTFGIHHHCITTTECYTY